MKRVLECLGVGMLGAMLAATMSLVALIVYHTWHESNCGRVERVVAAVSYCDSDGWCRVLFDDGTVGEVREWTWPGQVVTRCADDDATGSWWVVRTEDGCVAEYNE